MARYNCLCNSLCQENKRVHFFGLTKLFHTFSYQMLTGAALSGTVARKGREIHGSGEKKREVVCAVS